MSLGSFAFFHPDMAKDDFTIRHEMDGHTVDSKIFGPLYLFVMKQFLTLTLCCLGAAAMLCACGGNAGNKSGKDKAAADSLAAAEKTAW